MSTMTIKATDLRNLLAPVIPHASTDRNLPALNAVLLRSNGEYVTASATDRYSLAMQRIKPDGAAPDFRAVVALDVLKRILAIFKPTRANDPVLELDAEGPVLAVTVMDALDDGMGGSLTFPLVTDVYPQTDRLLARALAFEPIDVVPMDVNPVFLADFAKGQPRHEPIHVSPGGPNGHGTNWLIRVGDDFLGLLTGVRFAGPSKDADPWTDLLDVEADEEAAS